MSTGQDYRWDQTLSDVTLHMPVRERHARSATDRGDPSRARARARASSRCTLRQ